MRYLFRFSLIITSLLLSTAFVSAQEPAPSPSPEPPRETKPQEAQPETASPPGSTRLTMPASIPDVPVLWSGSTRPSSAHWA